VLDVVAPEGLVVADEQAAKLHVAQPALGRQIRDLEAELGVALFERTSRFVRLTDAGKAFLREARAVLERADTAARTARAFATGDRGELHLGYAPSLTAEVLPQALQAFEKQCPRVRVTLHDLSNQEMFRALREGRLDAALTVQSSPKQTRGLAFEKLRAYPACVAVNRTHRLACAQRVHLAQLNNERLMVYSRAEYPDYHESLNTLFGQAVRPLLEHAEEHDSGTSLIAAVEAGRGVAIVSTNFSRAAGPRLTLLSIEPSPEPLAVGLAYRPRHLSPVSRRFVKVVSALVG
jgi:LysR family transcriptional regulator, benzoate and cis,cis-muconate-responsive activator of ben and cat genes